MKATLFVSLVLLLTLACGDSTKKEISEKKADNKTTNWARPGAQGRMSGAYFVYKNELSVSDTLVSAESPQAKMTQIHESYTTDDGLAGMREMKNIVVEPGEELVLKQGGLHVMLMNLKQNLSNSDSVNITLNFKQAGNKELIVPVLSDN